MNYAAIYDRLMERARGRVLSGYVERHHIVPKCMGGGNEKENIVALTAEEHYVAHQLLVRIHQGNVKLVFSAMSMAATSKNTTGRSTNKLYGWLRQRHSQALSVSMKGHKSFVNWDDARRKWWGDYQRGRKRGPRSEEVKKKISAGSIGKKMSMESRLKMSAIRKGIRNTEEQKRKISEALSGRPKTLEHRLALSEAAFRRHGSGIKRLGLPA